MCQLTIPLLVFLCVSFHVLVPRCDIVRFLISFCCSLEHSYQNWSSCWIIHFKHVSSFCHCLLVVEFHRDKLGLYIEWNLPSQFSFSMFPTLVSSFFDVPSFRCHEHRQTGITGILDGNGDIPNLTLPPVHFATELFLFAFFSQTESVERVTVKDAFQFVHWILDFI